MIRKFFLYADAWKIFLSFVGLFVIIGLISAPNYIPFSLKKLFFSFAFIFELLWLYILGTNLNSKLPTKRSMSLILFKSLLISSIICFYLWQYFNIGHLFIFILINGSFLYLVYYVSKCLVSVENQKLMGFYDYIGIFYLVWLLPVGVWWLQPRIRKIFKEDFA